MSKNSVFSASMAVAFVWFTTHFGGGFASGRQAVQYYNNFGWYAVFTPLLAMAILAVVFYFSWDLALFKKTYDYRHWANEMYKPYQKVFANLFEIMYNLILLTATAIAFATGGETIATTLGTPYILNTIIIAIFIFFLTIYGADVIRKAASFLGVLIVIGLVVIYGANMINGMPQIVETIKAAPSPKGFGTALWNAIIYAGFQVAVVGAYVSVSDVLKDRRDVFKASLYGYILNASMLLLTTIVLLGFYPDVNSETIPIIYVLRNGVGAVWMEVVISLLILAGVVTTGVNLIYGGAKRVVSLWPSNESGQSERKKNIIASGVYVLITWAIALFGLIPLIAKGYGYIGYASLFLIVIPVLLKGIFFRDWDKGISSNNK